MSIFRGSLEEGVRDGGMCLFLAFPKFPGVGSEIGAGAALEEAVHHDSPPSGQGAVSDGNAGSGGGEVRPEEVLVVSIDFGEVGYFGEVEVHVEDVG